MCERGGGGGCSDVEPQLCSGRMTESRLEDGVEAEGEKVGMREEKGRVLLSFFFFVSES